MNVTEILAAKLVAIRYEDLPPEVVRVARDVVLDGIGNMLAGSREPLGPILADYVRSLGGPPDATVIGHGFKTHPVHAAFANGAFCHSMDFELMWYPPTHPTGTSLPAILALAEQQGFSGRDAVLALALAFEVQGRLRLCTVSTGPIEAEGIHPPGLIGAFGSATAAAKLLQLDAVQTRMALGIAGSRAGGLSANTGTMTKSTHSGNSARMGLESALLAQRGFTGSTEIFEGKRGFNHVLFHNTLDMDLLVQDFGSPYRMVEPGLIVKRFPAQYPTHWSIVAALALRERHHLDPGQIDTVLVEVGADNPAAGRVAKTGLDGKFSVEYTVAAALLDGAVRIDTFRDSRRFAPDMVAMLERVRTQRNPAIHAMDFAKAWARVTVQLKDGRELTERVDRPLGIWDNPLPWEGRVEKFRDCARQAISDADAQRLLGMIEDFEHLPSLRPLMELVQ